MTARPPDWTCGVPRIVLSRCKRCGTSWYLPHERCPACWSERYGAVEAAGTGLCVAVTRVHTAGDAGDGPVGLALAELDEGVLVMGRAGDRLRPGDRVRLSFSDTAAGALAPTFRRTA